MYADISMSRVLPSGCRIPLAIEAEFDNGLVEYVQLNDNLLCHDAQHLTSTPKLVMKSYHEQGSYNQWGLAS